MWQRCDESAMSDCCDDEGNGIRWNDSKDTEDKK